MSVFSYLLTLLLALGVPGPPPLPKAPVQASPPMLSFPVPAGVPNQLFYLQRDPNTNTVIYQLNVNNAGKVDDDEPINVFWLRYDEQGQRKELNFIQRKFAYGLSADKVGPEKFVLKFAAYNKVPFYLMRSGLDRAFHVFAVVNSRYIALTRVYLRIEGGTFWVPNVRYIELKGWDATTHAPVVTRLSV
ncbi:hypothetical protein GCM10023172_07010 [Hymenobacter ginsengisoli]|uniref:DUF4833 domain-containing protein n=1 Tax=Hymenobacter ginsengisoli TaxID=1051626 RepID=A0ABP8PYW7_9BACT|nr:MULTISPECIES: DUF4833 domain-containing protein [unclassified Hymenobacter]MBO2032649.1 DUF4833 domain-containing protein [Hymenobacter sp. BT559]